MYELTIEPAKEGKGRSFSATLLSFVTADNLWSGGQTSTDVVRPVWMLLGGSDNELRPFVANLRTGRKAEYKAGYSRRSKEKFEVLKSSRFCAAWNRTPVGSTCLLYEPDLFRLDPGMVDPKGASFCLLPEDSWINHVSVEDKAREFAASLAIPEEKREELLALAPIFIAYLDRRTRCPLIPDQRFYIQVLAAALSQGYASLSKDKGYTYYSERNWGVHSRMGFLEVETSTVGLKPGLAFDANHASLEGFLAEQVQLYFEKVKA